MIDRELETIPLIDGCLSARVDLSDNDTTIYTGDGRLLGYFVSVIGSAHVVPILDAAAEIMSLVATVPVSSVYMPLGPPEGIEFLTSLVIDPDDSASGIVTFFYQPYPTE